MNVDPNKPGLSVDVTPVPVAPATDVLSNVASAPNGPQGVVARDLLDGKAQIKADREAEGDFVALFENAEALTNYGNTELEPLNKLIDDAAAQIPPVVIPELQAKMGELHRDMRKLSGKYDMGNPKVIAWVRDSVAGIKRGWFTGESIFDAILFDAKNTYQKLDTVKAVVKPKELQAVKNVGLLDTFYRTNDSEILALIYRIAVMESIQSLGEAAARNIKADPGKPSDQPLITKRNLLTEFANNMSLKSSSFKGRLFLGWANGPQLITKRTLNLSLAVRLNMITNVSLPSVKFAVEQWELAIQMQQLASIIELTENFNNEVLTQAAKAGAQVAAYVVDTTQAPALRPESIKAIADAIASQADATAQAYVLGLQRRQEADKAIFDSQKLIANSQNKVSDAFLNKVIANANTARQVARNEQNELLALAKQVPAAAAA
ncbi:MAG: hypothetical protein HYV90_02505 [Candidatus Woesebacteria bacterium]|nr:MAG: hypothetical protein HYV90_02505 [Candidatus Woesebacteria bacterium]